MEKRKALRRKPPAAATELHTPKTGARMVSNSDAESTVSTRSSSSSTGGSSVRWKQKQLDRLEDSGQSVNRTGGTKGNRHREDEGEENAESPVFRDPLGAIIETTEAQMAMILLIALDVCLTAVEMHLRDRRDVEIALQQLNNSKAGAELSASLLTRVAARLLESFTGFTLFLFLIELAVLAMVFRRKFFTHAGYILDMAVVATSLAVELYAQTKGRPTCLRMIVYLQRLLHLRMQKDAARESLKREYESREGLEQLLRGYKDEIATLKEALQIAAQAVAEATIGEGDGGASPVELAMIEAGEPLSDAVAASTSNELYGEGPAVVYPVEIEATSLETEAQVDKEESDFEDAADH
ncbi:hypothetical protein BBJ28_00015380 [Nothophytophthora sp. Chile5]|nr:hypothetical protein BBJ28_00015380 [Nothophytophthora sp. Chile5]